MYVVVAATCTRAHSRLLFVLYPFQMVRFGADQVFRSKDSTITDEDIDLILARGEQKTAEHEEKLKSYKALSDFSSDGSYYTMDGHDYSGECISLLFFSVVGMLFSEVFSMFVNKWFFFP